MSAPPVDRIRELLMRAVHEIQTLSGRDPGVVSGSTRPLAELDDFDSLNAIEVVAQTSVELNTDLPEEVFAPHADGTAATLDEIAHRIFRHLERTQNGA